MTKVIYRKDSTNKEIIAFLPEVEARVVYWDRNKSGMAVYSDGE